jgi:uroporphyrin-3 C-methyltransferase
MNTEVSIASPGSRAWGPVLGLLLLAALAAAGYGGWHMWHASHETEDTVAAQEALLIRLSHQLSEAQSSIEQLSERQSDLIDALHQNTDDVARLRSRGDDLAQQQAQLSADLKGGRTRAQLVAVEQLLLLANDRAQLAHDAHGAAVALQLAEQRLSAPAEPGLFEVRKAVAEERTALQALPQTDRAAAALSLSTLIAQAEAMPLRERPVARPPPPALTETPDSFKPGWGVRVWSSLRELFHAVFIVQRTDRPVDRLLPPEQEGLVKQLLALKLESARAALLLGDVASFRSALDGAVQWLGDYYRPEDPTVTGARAELERLRALDLDPALPDLSRSVGLLRAYLDAMPR